MFIFDESKAVTPTASARIQRWPLMLSDYTYHFRHMTNSFTTAVTIAKLKSRFATLGLPVQLVTDNGPSFTSEEFAEFLLMNGIKHITTAPYHLGSNGLAERAVQTLKRGLKMISEGS